MRGVPILDGLIKLHKESIVSFHVPGHKNGRIFEKLNYYNLKSCLINIDTTEIDGTDYLYNPTGIIKEAQEKAKDIFKSKETFFLVNGSTSGIHSMIMACTRPGDEIIVGRDCHLSVMNSIFIGDLKPVFIYPKINMEQGITMGISPYDVEKALEENPEAKAVAVTYPNYYGIAGDLKKIADITHRYNKTLLVDEAHGAHLGLSRRLPATALDCGADAVVQSTHKTLPSFTQSAMLHIQGNRIDIDKLKFMLRIHQSSSPSYLLLASLDLAREIYASHGRELMEQLLENIDYMRNLIIESDEDIILRKETEGDDSVKAADPTRIWISFYRRGISGYELSKRLRHEFNIQMELSNLYGTLGIATIGNEKEDFIKLCDALKTLLKEKKNKNNYEFEGFRGFAPQKAYGLRQAFYKEKMIVPLKESAGRISAEYVIPYPPGIPLLIPGEIIEKDMIMYLQTISRQDGEIIGLTGKEGLYVNVIK